jgi:hypothetical protein
MYGRSDPIVPVSQSCRLASALCKAGSAVQAIERSDCDQAITIALPIGIIRGAGCVPVRNDRVTVTTTLWPLRNEMEMRAQ